MKPLLYCSVIVAIVTFVHGLTIPDNKFEEAVWEGK